MRGSFYFPPSSADSRRHFLECFFYPTNHCGLLNSISVFHGTMMLPLRTESTVNSHTLGHLLTSITVSSNIKTRKIVFVLVHTTTCFVETDKFTVPYFWLEAIFVTPYIATSWKQNNLASHMNGVWRKCNYVCLFHNAFINSRESNYCQDIWHILSPSPLPFSAYFTSVTLSYWWVPVGPAASWGSANKQESSQGPSLDGWRGRELCSTQPLTLWPFKNLVLSMCAHCCQLMAEGHGTPRIHRCALKTVGNISNNKEWKDLCPSIWYQELNSSR